MNIKRTDLWVIALCHVEILSLSPIASSCEMAPLNVQDNHWKGSLCLLIQCKLSAILSRYHYCTIFHCKSLWVCLLSLSPLRPEQISKHRGFWVVPVSSMSSRGGDEVFLECHLLFHPLIPSRSSLAFYISSEEGQLWDILPSPRFHTASIIPRNCSDRALQLPVILWKKYAGLAKRAVSIYVIISYYNFWHYTVSKASHLSFLQNITFPSCRILCYTRLNWVSLWEQSVIFMPIHCHSPYCVRATWKCRASATSFYCASDLQVSGVNCTIFPFTAVRNILVG